MSFWKCLGKVRILRAASLAEIGGLGFIRFQWVDWIFYFICTVVVSQRFGLHCECLPTLMVLNRDTTHVLNAKAYMMLTVGLLCGYG